MEYTSVQVSYSWFPGRCHICPRAAGLTSIIALEVTRIVVPFFTPERLFESDSNNGPSLGHSNLVSDEVYICSGHLLMISWWSPYLDKGPMPDFNIGPGNDLNSNRNVSPWRLFESDSNYGPLKAIPMLNCKHKLARKRT